MDPTVACRLIHASTLAYGINLAGTAFDQTEVNWTLIQDIGLAPATVKFARADTINACYWGETNANEVLLSFRGTLPPTDASKNVEWFFAVLADWLNDANVQQVKGQDLPGLVHAGFLGSLDSLWPGIDIGALKSAAAGKKFYVTGHSKGGALAFLAAYRLTRTGVPPSAVYTFASPRTGNGDFVTAYNQVCPSTWRFEYQDDLVPHLPPHTGAWMNALKAHRAVATKFPAQAPHPKADPDVLAQFEALLTRLEALSIPDYVSAGILEFINWDTPPKLQPDSFELEIKREFSLAEKLAEFELVEVADDHSASVGYTTGACGAAVA